MRLYYEANEIVGIGEEAEFIRADITNMNDKEKEDTLQAIKDVMAGKKCTLQEHECDHEHAPGHVKCRFKEI